MPKTDPFNGMYLASYGEHGSELLRLYREKIDGEEVVIAQKLTGTPACAALLFSSPPSKMHVCLKPWK